MIPNSNYVHFILQFFDTVKDIVLGAVGGIVAYMYDYTKHKRNNEEVVWNNSAMLINAFLGGFTANAIGSFIPMDTIGRDGVIGFIGVSSYAILGIIESKFAQMLLQKFTGINTINNNNNSK